MDKTRIRLIILVAALSVILGGLIGGVAAKYVMTKEFSGTVTFSAKLATGITLKESKAIKGDDGKYVLGAEATTQNTYTLLPGLDIPKDPLLSVTGKTPIPAYLFVEVVESTGFNGSILSYELDAHWKKLDGITGKHGGTVYVYVSSDAPVVLSGTPADFSLNILKGQKVTVGQKLLQTSAENILTFYGLMAEAAQDTKIPGTVGTLTHAAEVYKALVNTATNQNATATTAATP